MSIHFYSTFAGIGGFDLGFERAGMRCVGQSELIGHRRATLARHFPHVTNLQGDIQNVRGDSIGEPDLIVGGFPCKDLSIAAPHRTGLDGGRSGLYFEFTRLVAEYLRLAREQRPRWLVLENTPGMLSSRKGRDMAAVVMGLEELGYGWAYRVVDGGYLGTTQRRRRVVVVAHRGGDPRPALAVLGDADSGGRLAPASDDRGPGPRPGARALAGSDSLDRVWVKGANPRMSIEHGYEGGYRETWKDATGGFGRTLTGFDGGNATRQTHLIAQGGRLRTLTLTEWERLSGFPDGWTEGMPQSERFSTLGDCFHPGTAEWLGHRLVGVHNALTAHPSLFADLAAANVEPVTVGDQYALFA